MKDDGKNEKMSDARKAIRNLARLTRGALFLEVLTREDWERNTEQGATDGKVIQFQ